jgi:hypothetical protein
MPNASTARIQYEESQTAVGITELTNQGDNERIRGLPSDCHTERVV